MVFLDLVPNMVAKLLVTWRPDAGEERAALAECDPDAWIRRSMCRPFFLR
jgi:hypothetical protein